MAATLTRTTHPLPTPIVLADLLPATVTLDGWQNATCDCDTDLGQVQSLTAGWVDLDAVDDEINAMFHDHLMSGEAGPDCVA